MTTSHHTVTGSDGRFDINLTSWTGYFRTRMQSYNLNNVNKSKIWPLALRLGAFLGSDDTFIVL